MHQLTTTLERPRTRTLTFLTIVAVAAGLLAMRLGPFGPHSAAHAARETDQLPVVALPSYHVSLFTRGTAAYTHPDSIVVSDHIWIDYQNVTAKDGSDGKSSTIVEYTESGDVVRTFSVKGHSDGLRLNPYTHTLWATVNEDGNPALYVISLHTAHIDTYSLAAPHGGGYDDIAFQGGVAYLTASNPTLNSAGVNTFPALVKVKLNPDHSTTLDSVLAGNASAFDIVNKTQVTLNEVDPDSLSIDSKGQLVIVNQGGSEVVFIDHPATSQQAVTSAPVGTQLDDTVWVKSRSGRLYVVDGTQNATYIVRTTFGAGTVYTETPDDSGVAGLLGTLDLTTGRVTPVAIGFGKPSGLVYVAGDSGGDDQTDAH